MKRIQDKKKSLSKISRTIFCSRYYKYKKEWDAREEASEKVKRELIMSIRKRMMQIADPSPVR